MLIEQQKKQYRALDQWFQTPLGLFSAHEFVVNLEPATDYLKGDTLIQLGQCGDNIWLEKTQYRHQWIVSPFALAQKVHIESELNHLPFERNSIDCVIAPLTLEPFNNSYSIIDEVDRVLKPMGYVVFLCVNPWSLWGGALKSGFLHCYRESNIKMHTSFNLNRIFIQRGYRQVSLSNFCYLPPINSVALIKRLTFLDEIGKMVWPFPSGFYCYIAQKHQMIEPSLRTSPLKVPRSDYEPAMQPVVRGTVKLG